MQSLVSLTTQQLPSHTGGHIFGHAKPPADAVGLPPQYVRFSTTGTEDFPDDNPENMFAQ